MTIVPSIGTVSRHSRIASTADLVGLWRSPWPMVWAQAIAACLDDPEELEREV